MILTVLRLTSVPSRAGEVVQGLRALMRAARAEKGLLACNLYLDAEDANTVRYEEWWQSREDFEEQVCSSHFTQLLALMESALEPPSLEFHFIAETRGLDYIAAVRGETQHSS